MQRMHILTYLITCIALVVIGRAVFSSDKKDASADTTEVLVQESVILNAVKDPGTINDNLDSSPLKSGQAVVKLSQNDPTAYAGQATPGATTSNPPLIIHEKPEANSQQPAANIPSNINHPVTFFPQAPDGNRSLPRQEACEEASIILANYFIKGKSLTKDQMRSDILALVDRQMELFGDYLHTTVEQTKQLYEDFYGGESYILDNPTIDTIKSVLAQGHIIVAPFAGRKLGNPYYSAQGPWYHMMVIKGYDDSYFYTNDVGTRRGENFAYSHQTIMNALHDLNMDDINQGAKRMLVIMK